MDSADTHDKPGQRELVLKVERKHAASLAIILFALVVWTFLPTLGNDFISYDDPAIITKNPLAQQGLSVVGIRWALTAVVSGNWQPLTSLSHLIDCQIFGMEPWGHHLTSVLWHGANTVLVFLVLLKMTGGVGRSWTAAALFGLHPLRVESVAWVAERKDVMSGFFLMLTLWAYTAFAWGAPREKRRHYVLALLAFCGGLLCKPMLVTLPCVLLLLDYWPFHRWTPGSAGRLFLEKAPFFLLAAVSSVVTLRTQMAALMPLAQLTLWDRGDRAAIAYCRYLEKLFWPHPLVTPCTPPQVRSAGVLLLAFALLAGMSAGVVAARRRGYLFTGWFWYLGTLVPVIGLVQVGGQAMADRYTYMPSLGIVLLVVWGVYDLIRGWRWQQWAAWAATVGLVVACMAQTRQQVHYWKNSAALFGHAVEVNPDDPGASWLMAKTYEDEGRFEEAANLWRKIVSLLPDNADAHDSYAFVLQRLGHAEEAVAELQVSARLRPNDSGAEDNVGIALAQAGRWDEAVAHLERSVKLDARNARAEINLGLALEGQGHKDLAIEHYRRATVLEPANEQARSLLAAAAAANGRTGEAGPQKTAPP